MLATSFKTAEELKLTQPQLDALIKTLGMLERGEVVHARSCSVLHISLEMSEEEVLQRYYQSPPIPNTDLVFSLAGRFRGGTFNMMVWNGPGDCGTVHCIGGWAEAISGRRFNWRTHSNEQLYYLFYPPIPSQLFEGITVQQAAMALRNFLVCGKAMWGAILGVDELAGMRCSATWDIAPRLSESSFIHRFFSMVR